MDKALIYCSGPISAATYEEATDWYADVNAYLYDAVYGRMFPGAVDERLCPWRLLRPMRGKDFLRTVSGPLGDGGKPYPWATLAQEHMVSRQGIYRRDRADVLRCDAVLVNLIGAEELSAGCIQEIGWADAWNKPVIVACEPGNVHDTKPLMRGAATYWVEQLDSACAMMAALLDLRRA